MMRALVLVLASWSGAAAAQDTGAVLTCLRDAARGEACIGHVSKACMAARADGETTLGMVDCIGAETAAWDGLLNVVYRDRMAEAKAADASGDVLAPDLTRSATLRAAQRAWIAFRDAECLMRRAQYGSGSLGQVAGANCLLDETAFRVLALRGLADG